MVEQTVKLVNPTGLSLHPAGILCREAMAFRSSVHFRFGNVEGNAKSVLSVLGADVRSEDEITLICEGEDEEEALKHMIEVIEGGLGE